MKIVKFSELPLLEQLAYILASLKAEEDVLTEETPNEADLSKKEESEKESSNDPETEDLAEEDPAAEDPMTAILSVLTGDAENDDIFGMMLDLGAAEQLAEAIEATAWMRLKRRQAIREYLCLLDCYGIPCPACICCSFY